MTAPAAAAPTVLAWTRERETSMAGLLSRLVEAESPSLVPGSVQAALELLAAELESAGLRTRLVGGEGAGRHLLARPRIRGERCGYQLLLGHADTVWPVGTLRDMPARRADGSFFGPGCYDMKGGLVQLVFAVAALHDLGLEPRLAPVVFVNSDEEIGSVRSARYIRRLARSAARAFVLEPPAGPAGMLKTGRKGVERFEIVVKGRAAHAGTSPEAGASAILELSRQVQELFALSDPEHGVTVNVGTIDGGLRPNVVAPEATAEVDVRVPTLAAAEDIETAIRSLEPVQEGVVLEVDGGFGRPPMEATPRNLELFSCAQTLAELLGLPLETTAVGGGSDANITSLYTATLDGLGPVGEGAHAVDERVVVERMPERAALLALLVLAPPAHASARQR
jgi:glutamate carboxypeptidase